MRDGTETNKEGLFLLMDLSLRYHPEAPSVYRKQSGAPQWCPGFGLVPGSALGLLPSIALSSAQADSIVAN
jgi:hypothetical protein